MCNVYKIAGGKWVLMKEYDTEELAGFMRTMMLVLTSGSQQTTYFAKDGILYKMEKV